MILEVEDLCVSYRSIQAVRGLSLGVDGGELVTLVGPNGAGKSSTLLAIAGGLPRKAASGSVRYAGREILGVSPERIVRAGVALVPERRRIFNTLTVAENLAVAISARRDRVAAKRELAEVLERFPALSDAQHRSAGLLSGGQQQQLAIGRALLTKPSLLLLDEPSLGLSPLIVDEIFALIGTLREQGLAILLLEQNALRAVEVADRAMLISRGTATAIAATHDSVLDLASYLGVETRKGDG